MKPNWTAIITSSLTALVGLACAILALTLGKDNQGAQLVLMGVAGTALGSFIKQPQKIGIGAAEQVSEAVTKAEKVQP